MANRKWITTNEGVGVYNDRRWVNYTIQNSGLPDNIVPAIAIDRENVKWFGTLNGLCSFDGENWHTWNTSNSPLPANQINDIAIDDDGLLWIGTSGGAAVFDGIDRWVVFTAKNSPLPAGNIYKVANDKNGNHWFGNDNKGLAKLSGFVMPAKATASKSTTTADNKTPTTTKPQQQSEGSSDEKVRINPHLADGYITISIESPSATITFTNSDGKVVKTVPSYKNGQRINIGRMTKGMYTVGVKTVRGEKKIKFNLK